MSRYSNHFISLKCFISILVGISIVTYSETKNKIKNAFNMTDTVFPSMIQ